MFSYLALAIGWAARHDAARSEQVSRNRLKHIWLANDGRWCTVPPTEVGGMVGESGTRGLSVRGSVPKANVGMRTSRGPVGDTRYFTGTRLIDSRYTKSPTSGRPTVAVLSS